MATCDISTTDFALSENGIHLLRSGYNYKTIAWHSIESALIKRGPQINNPFLSFAAGSALAVFALAKAASLYNDFTDPAVRRVYIEAILLPLLPAMIGLYSIYTCFSKGPVLQVRAKGAVYQFHLREVATQERMEQLKNVLNHKLAPRFSVQDGF